jgi:ABC-type methionine transport system ATPase subunit
MQARITLARAVYSSAQVLLLDDILSALDVHTSRWIVDQCLAGNLLKGRTVLLVTHNILLAGSIAEYGVALNLDGTVQCQGPVKKLLNDNKELVAAAEQEMPTDGPKEPTKMEQNEDHATLVKIGKQTVEEELAIGHVGWPVCEYMFFAYLLIN